MPTALFILVFGDDLTLLNTRAGVLRLAGYRVEVVSDRNKLWKHEPDLIILCHSLPWVERVAVLQSAMMTWPDARRLCLTNSRESSEGSATFFRSFEGPAKLIQVVRHMLLQK